MRQLLHFLLVVCLVLMPGVVQSGTVVLKNGHVINGQIIVSDDEKVIMTWGNGRTTIYHRFIESVSLTEEEELAVRMYQNSREVVSVADLVEPIELPDFSELHSPDPVEAVEGVVVSQEEIAVVSEGEESTSDDFDAPTILEKHEFQGLGFSIELPASWSVNEYNDSVSFKSDCEEVLIAVDQYTEGAMTADRAALGLQESLNQQGFGLGQNGLVDFMVHLAPEFSVESLTPDTNHHAVHALLNSASAEETSLVSVYWTVNGNEVSGELLEEILSTMIFSAPQG